MRIDVRHEMDKITAGHRLDLNLERGYEAFICVNETFHRNLSKNSQLILSTNQNGSLLDHGLFSSRR
ncbi:unnamed protein product, partial [Vitis vinifera]|uniref:Uncharacterized protein n=1 Tax=Vitis vinifera TaxID=29760 RepID=D7U5H9_VITVI